MRARTRVVVSSCNSFEYSREAYEGSVLSKVNLTTPEVLELKRSFIGSTKTPPSTENCGAESGFLGFGSLEAASERVGQQQTTAQRAAMRPVRKCMLALGRNRFRFPRSKVTGPPADCKTKAIDWLSTLVWRLKQPP